MSKLTALLNRWPLIQQLRSGLDGTGPEVMSERTRSLRPKHDDAAAARSVCPFCAVGCGQLVYHRDGRVVSIEGDPASPISAGTLCPKGSASHELVTHSGRQTTVKYRAAGATAWQHIDLEAAMDMVAERVWRARERTFVESRDGEPVMHSTAVAHLGGATLDNEENYLIKKLFTGGLGLVCVSNQARI